MSNKDNQKPFSIGYVMRTTARHMSRAVSLSVEKTMARIPEFADNPEKSNEVFTTLTKLQAMKAQVEAIENAYPADQE
jgi:aspartyl/asparaginyl beta-hydroxylase (cupin superfamily)